MAIGRLGRALRWYTPVTTTDREAIAELWRLGAEAEERGDAATALAAFRQIRRGILATRWLLVPNEDRLEAANARIASLMADQGALDARGRPADRPARVAEHEALLSRSPTPSPWLSLLAVIAFLAWVAAAFGGVYLGLDEQGSVRLRPLAACGGAWVLALAVWLIALGMA